MSIPSDSLPQFDELYVISDLHLGGPPGFQIFNSGAEVEKLVNALRASDPNRPDRRVALVVNGDLVDFLAERPARHFDPAGAVDKLNRIVKDPAFAPVFRSLQKFAATRNRSLVITLGNHDVELALPWVREHLLDLLSGGNEAARGRITLSFDGAGFLCRVGNAQVLCVHGNEVDTWNVTDHETIRRIGRDLTHGLPVQSWIPNAGTQLVIDVMNDLKGRYPFIDLLKPEMEGVIPTILALAPDQRDKVRAVAATARRLALDKIRRATGFLGSEEEVEEAVALPAGVVAGSFGSPSSRKVLLDETEERIRSGVDPLSLVPGDQRGEYLGMSGAVLRFFRGEDTSEVLREALEQLRADRSFDFTAEDATFKSLDESIGGDVDFVIAGHTHLERALRRKKGRGWYFNSGTWVRLIRLEKDVLGDRDRFRTVFDAFKAGTMDALDQFKDLVLRRLTVAAIWTDGQGTHGELRHVGLKPSEPLFSPVPGSRFKRI
ncbi:MAG TPA: metallophosphoesterase [Thermoanaerobaculia bacterium]|nr:metallophosphoesterase [Thermoanaerobaculia bacterium]